MTNYSGSELVKQEFCKLTYATFLSDVVVCYDKVANELVLNNPYFYETTYDATTMTLSNSAFNLRKVELKSHYGAQFIVGLDMSNTGLELILKAEQYTRKQVIPYRHLTICNSLPCYDFGENFPYCKRVLYKGKDIWPCLGSGREMPITDENDVTIEDNCIHFTCYDFSKTLGRELNFTEEVRYKGDVIWECFNLDRVYDETTGHWIEGGPILGVFEFFNGDIVVTDPNYIYDTCKAIGQISTPIGCQEPYLSGTPCTIATDSMSIFEVPLVDISFGAIMNSIGYYDYFFLNANGDIVGYFKDSFDSYKIIHIALFNIFDYFTPRGYKVEGYHREIDVYNFILKKYFEETGTEFAGDPDIDNKLSSAELLQLFPSLNNATFNWIKPVRQSFGNATGNRAPCDYKKISVNNSPEESRTIIDYKFTNNYISNIESSGIDATELQADYDAFCDKAKWLLTSKAYAYAVYKGYLDPNTPIEY